MPGGIGRRPRGIVPRVGWLASLQRTLIFPRFLIERAPVRPPAVADLERLAVPSPEGPVEAWFLPARGDGGDRPAPLVLFAHGNAELIDRWPAELERYRELGLGVVLPEYRGYGRNPGAPSAAAIVADLLALHDLLAARPDVDRRRIVFHGRGPGGGAVWGRPAARPPAALILQSTFSGTAQMARRFRLPESLVTERFDNLGVLRRLDCPVLVLHGRRDRLIPFRHAEELCRAARNSRLVALAGGVHDTRPSRWPGFWNIVRQFLLDAGILTAR
jgi:fermentation-respiration switch protein FrsA (DUF1100 family)